MVGNEEDVGGGGGGGGIMDGVIDDDIVVVDLACFDNDGLNELENEDCLSSSMMD